MRNLSFYRETLFQPHLDPRNFPHYSTCRSVPPCFIHPLSQPIYSLSCRNSLPTPSYNNRSVPKRACYSSPAQRRNIFVAPLVGQSVAKEGKGLQDNGTGQGQAGTGRGGTSPTWAIARKLPLCAREIDQRVTLVWRLVRIHSAGSPAAVFTWLTRVSRQYVKPIYREYLRSYLRNGISCYIQSQFGVQFILWQDIKARISKLERIF